MGHPPEGLLAQTFDVNDIVASDGYLYATNHLGLYRISSDGSEVRQLVACQHGFALSLACDGEKLYWVRRANSPWVKSLAEHNECDLLVTSCSTGETTCLATDQRGVLGLTVSGDTVYWINEEVGCDSPKGRIMACPKDGGTPREVASGLLFIKGIGRLLAADATSLYSCVYLEGDPETEREAGDVVVCAPKAGGEAEIFATGIAISAGLAVDERHLHGIDELSGRVARFDTSGSGACATLERREAAPDGCWEPHFMIAPEIHLCSFSGTPGPETPWLLVSGANHLYVFTRREVTSGRLSAIRLLRVAKADGASVELAAWEAWSGPFAAATDDHHVYFEGAVPGVGQTLVRVSTGLVLQPPHAFSSPALES